MLIHGGKVVYSKGMYTDSVSELTQLVYETTTKVFTQFSRIFWTSVRWSIVALEQFFGYAPRCLAIIARSRLL